MLKVILTKGLSGSGKSTWSKDLVERNSGYKRISKDDLREMLDVSKFTDANEKFILKVRDHLILMCLEEGKNVIIDDTNLSDKHFNRIKELVKGKAEVSIQDFTHIPLEDCIKRDLKRLHSVGKDVIMKQYNQFLKPEPETAIYNPNLPNAIIVDLDGTLTHLNGRSPYDASTCEDDGLDDVIAGLVKDNYDKGRIIILCSGRDDKYREQTEKFLARHHIPYQFLYMRNSLDFRKDAIVKEEMYRNHIQGKYNVKYVLEDRNQAVELWRSLGLKCFQVAEGDF